MVPKMYSQKNLFFFLVFGVHIIVLFALWVSPTLTSEVPAKIKINTFIETATIVQSIHLKAACPQAIKTSAEKKSSSPLEQKKKQPKIESASANKPIVGKK